MRLMPKNPAPLALATLAGILYFPPFLDFRFWALSWVALVPLLIVLERTPSGRKALKLSWWTGFVLQVGGFYWIVHTMMVFGHLHWALSVLGLLLLAAGQGLLFGALGWVIWHLRRRTGVAIGWIAPVALIAVEFVFPQMFPSYTANSQVEVPYVTQIADLGGVLLITGLIGLVNGALAEVALAVLDKRPRPRVLLGVASAAVLLTVGYSAIRLRQVEAAEKSVPTLKTALIQANVGGSSRYTRVAQSIELHKEMSEAVMDTPGLGLIVWPEGAFNRSVMGPPGLPGVSLTRHLADDIKVPMIVGSGRVMRGENGRKVWNSAFAVAPGGAVVGTYDKIKLFAFGEYVPGDQLWPGVYKLLPYSGHYERGTTVDPLPVGPYKLSTDICYEDILPRLIRTLMIPIDAQGTRPHAMVNVTNDSWYGPVEPHIHLALARFRAIEHRRWLVRATLTGISAFVDSSGRLVKHSGFETVETLVHDVPMITAGPTVYGVIGDVVGWAALAAVAFGLLQRRWRPREQAGDRAAAEAGKAQAA